LKKARDAYTAQLQKRKEMGLDEAAQAEPVRRSEKDTQDIEGTETVHATVPKRIVDPKCIPKPFDGQVASGSASLPDPVALETEEQRLEREQNERDFLEALGDYKCDAGMSVEYVPAAVVHLKTLKGLFLAHKFSTSSLLGGRWGWLRVWKRKSVLLAIIKSET
jgi:hypothetical protein